MQILHSKARLEALCGAFARQEMFPDRRKQRPAACT